MTTQLSSLTSSLADDVLWAAAPLGIAVLDARLRIVRTNARFRTLTGCASETAKASLDSAAPRFWEKAGAALLGVARGEREELTIELGAMPERRSWIRVQAVRLRGGRATARVALFVHDITREKRQEERRSRSRRTIRNRVAEYETLLRVIPIGISIARDPECKTIISNRHHATLLGESPDRNTSIDPRAANPASFRIYRDGAEIGAHELPMHRAIAERREVLNVECDVVTAEGQRLTLVGHAAPLFREDNEIAGAVGAFANITERKRAEERLADSERRYRKLAEENARLYEEAKAAVRLRDEFVATISHELRTPLSAIVGWASMLREEHRGNERLDRGLGVIEGSARMQQRLIEDLLDVSRMMSDNLSIEKREIELDSVVSEALQALATIAQSKNVGIVSARSKAPIRIFGDADRLRQVVCNLVANAIKFAPGGKASVETFTDGESAFVRVTDDGVGIPPDFLPHIFERFRQAPGERGRRTAGLGLGLAIVRHIVELHGGRIDARSEGTGKGASFVVSLPLPDVSLVN